MRFEFAKYTDVTEYAKKLSEDNGKMGVYNGYEKILICPDTHDAWVVKILKGYNEEYAQDENKVLLERNKIDDFGARHRNIEAVNSYSRSVLMKDMEDGSNWDVAEFNSVEEAIEVIDDGFGIIEENAEEQK